MPIRVPVSILSQLFCMCVCVSFLSLIPDHLSHVPEQNNEGCCNKVRPVTHLDNFTMVKMSRAATAIMKIKNHSFHSFHFFLYSFLNLIHWFSFLITKQTNKKEWLFFYSLGFKSFSLVSYMLRCTYYTCGPSPKFLRQRTY